MSFKNKIRIKLFAKKEKKTSFSGENSAQDELLKRRIEEAYSHPKEDIDLEEKDWNAMFDRVISSDKKKDFTWQKVAAAILLLIVGSGILMHRWRKPDIHPSGIAQTEHLAPADIRPGGNKAILTLGNGQKLILDSANNGILSTQGNVKIFKVNEGVLAYQPGQKKKNRKAAEYNTITTPRGGKYEIILPDGSKVWLNSASSLKFPTAFNGNKRSVEMSGEAYFEIAKEAARPFYVHYSSSDKDMQKGVVKVLGTHFNINAYHEESRVKTTLLEGAVSVSEAHQSLLLKPGEAAQVNKEGVLKKETNVNTDGIIAWKKDLFWFDNADIHVVMHELSRWYNVNIQLEGDLTDRFTGYIPRSYTFSKVFEVLQKTGRIHYRIEGDNVIITK